MNPLIELLKPGSYFFRWTKDDPNTETRVHIVVNASKCDIMAYTLDLTSLNSEMIDGCDSDFWYDFIEMVGKFNKIKTG